MARTEQERFMEKSADRLAFLYRRYTTRVATPEELGEWFSYLDDPLFREQLEGLADEEWQRQAIAPEASGVDWDFMFRRIMASGTGVAVRPMPSRNVYFLRMAAAAAVLVLVVTTLFWWQGRDARPLAELPVEQRYQNDVAPGGNKAILTLADGRRIVLDTASGSIASEGGTTVINLQGQLSYEGTGGEGHPSAVRYHTISTPRGGQYQVVLADGSRVWLNAASSLHFPSSFPGKDRMVELTGEGYFEVAHRAGQPFRVKAGAAEIRVLGTHFNINSYADEPVLKTTLLEGAVKVLTDGQEALLRPGQQAQVQRQGASALRVLPGADLEEVMAWKEGKFLFAGVRIQHIMRELARWYDVDVSYSGPISDEEFFGSISRSEHISAVLKKLEATKTIRFTISGRKVTVMPYMNQQK